MVNIIMEHQTTTGLSDVYNVAQTPSWSAETDKYDRLHPVFVYLVLNN